MAGASGGGLSMADVLRLLSQGAEPGSYQSNLATVANQGTPGQIGTSTSGSMGTNKATSADTTTPSVTPETTPAPSMTAGTPAPSAGSDALSASLNVPSVPNVGLLATPSPSFNTSPPASNATGATSSGTTTPSGSSGVGMTPQQAQTIQNLGGMYSYSKGGLMSPSFGSTPTSSFSTFSTPSFGTPSSTGTPTNTSSGGQSLFGIPGLTVGDIVGFLGGIGSGIANYSLSKDQLAQQAAEFAKQYGLASGEAALAAKSQLNRAPLADKGQYLALNAAAPTPFQPRDYTSGGLGATRGAPTGGAAQQLAANAITANTYKPGMGGVDTSTIEQFLKSLGYG